MTAAALQPIEIFRPGRHTPMKGAALAFSAADLVQACRVYDPALHRAPLVVGHPKTDDLAYGNVAALSYSEAAQRVIAQPADVEPEFAEMVRDGRLLAVSASWYAPDSPSNPVPGSYYLRHVGFLGAQPPAIKGLKRPAVAFAEDEVGVLEFGDWADEQVASLFGRLRDWLISSLGLEKADQVLPSYAIDSLKREAMTPSSPAPAPSLMSAGLSYSDAGAPAVTTLTQEQLTVQAAELQTQRQALDARDADLRRREADTQRATQRAAVADFAEGLVRDGKLLPAHRAAVVELMASLPTTGELEFSEGDQAVKKPPLHVLQDFLKALPKQVDFSERAGAPKNGKTVTGDVDCSDGQAIAKAALEFQEAESKAGRTVSLEAAVSHVVYSNQEA